MGLKYYYNLDGIRGIAAIMVVIFHFFFNGNADYLKNLAFYQRFTEFGQHGVSLFFVLSGFVITRILLATRHKSDYFRTFYWRRILRILPLYYLYLIVFYYIVPLLTSSNITEFKLQIPYYIYLQNITPFLHINASGPGHYWSLAVEEHFYLLWPLVVYLVKPSRLWLAVLVIVLFVFATKYYMLNAGMSINYFTFTRIDQILFGAVLSILEFTGLFKSKYIKFIMVGSGLLILPVGALVYYFSSEIHFLKEMFKYTFLGLFFFSIIGYLVVSNAKSKINQVLSSSVFKYFGKISYGIYIWHVTVLALLNRFFITKILFLDILLAFSITILISHLSYNYFESWFLNMKDKKPALPSFIRVINH